MKFIKNKLNESVSTVITDNFDAQKYINTTNNDISSLSNKVEQNKYFLSAIDKFNNKLNEFSSALDNCSKGNDNPFTLTDANKFYSNVIYKFCDLSYESGDINPYFTICIGDEVDDFYNNKNMCEVEIYITFPSLLTPEGFGGNEINFLKSQPEMFNNQQFIIKSSYHITEPDDNDE